MLAGEFPVAEPSASLSDTQAVFRRPLVQLHRLPLHPRFRRNLLTQGQLSGRQLTLTPPSFAVSDNDGCPLIAAVAPARRSAAPVAARRPPEPRTR